MTIAQENLFHLFSNPWNLPTCDGEKKNNWYICLSGNSGVGKSRLLRSLGETLFSGDPRTVAVDEKSIHHFLLPSLFRDTQKYGFQIQLNFMLQRSLLINSCLDGGYNLIMERSHLEDPIFMKHLLREGVVTSAEYATYERLWEHLLQRTRLPNVMVCLDLPLDRAIFNVTHDENIGRRPKEFSSDAQKERWLSSWHQLYTDFFEEMRLNKHGLQIIEFTKNTTIDETVMKVMDALDIQPRRLP